MPVGGLLNDGRRSLSRLVAFVSLVLLGAMSVGRAEEPVAPAAPRSIPAARQANNVAIITIEGGIDGVTARSVMRRIREAEAGGADSLVIELNTPGGEWGATKSICDEIRGSTIKNTIAWVNKDAFSAGSIIAIACREVVVAPGATMGDAAPISGDPLGIGFMQGLRPTERSKALAPIIVEVVDSARANGYDEHLVTGLVTLDVELWLVEHTPTGKRYTVTAREYQQLFGRAPQRSVSPIVPSLKPSRLQEPVEVEAVAAAPSDDKALQTPLPGLTPDDLAGVNDDLSGLQLASARPDFSHADSDDFAEVAYVSDGSTLFTFKEDALKTLGFAAATVGTDEELKSFVGATNVRRLDQTWSESMVGFMTMGLSGLLIRGALIVVFLLAMFMELSMPGASIPGMVALVALAGLIVPPMLIGASTWWALAAIGVGVVLIAMEVFVFPGFGIPGIMGLVLLLGGLLGTFASPGQLFPGAGKGAGNELAWSLSTVLLAVFAAGVGMYLFSRYTHSFPVAGRLVLGPTARADDDEQSGLLSAMGVPTTEGPVQIGDVGVATTALRPSGTAEFNDQLVDVVSEVGFVDAGTRVRVSSVSEYRVGVEPARDSGGASA